MCGYVSNSLKTALRNSHANRRADALAEATRRAPATHRVKKNGKLGAAYAQGTSTSLQWVDLEGARRVAAYWESINPGMKFMVVE